MQASRLAELEETARDPGLAERASSAAELSRAAERAREEEARLPALRCATPA